MLRRNWFILVAVLMALGSAGCTPVASTGGGSQNILTQEDLASTGSTNLYQAIQRLRPRWLSVRASQTMGGAGATAVLVYQNQARLGGIEILREMDPRVAAWVEYLDGPTASATLPGVGSQDVEGAIIIHTTPRS